MEISINVGHVVCIFSYFERIEGKKEEARIKPKQRAASTFLFLISLACVYF